MVHMTFRGRSIFLQFFLSAVVVVVLHTSVMLVLLFREVKNFYESQLDHHLHTVVIAISDNVKLLLRESQVQNIRIDEFAKIYGSKLGMRITIVDPTGRVLGDTEEDPKRMENHGNRPEIRQALLEGSGSYIRFSTTLEHFLLYHALRIDGENGPLGVIRVSFFVDQIRYFLNSLKWRMVSIAGILMLGAGILAFLLSKAFYRPLKTICEALQDLAEGNFSTRVPYNLSGELGVLARHVNDTARRLEALFYELTVEKEELQSVVEGLQAGLVVLDMEGKILMTNTSFRSMALTGTEQLEGTYYWECFREAHMNTFFQQLRQHPSNSLREISVGKKMYLVSVTYVQKREKLIVIFHDITPVKETERVKRHLVANVSHELKTPLTAINGYVETLLEEEHDQTKRRYLNVVKRHVERLSNIAHDLITLNELETEKSLQLSYVDLEGIIHNVIGLFASRAKERGLTINMEVDPEAKTIKADHYKLEQLLINLIDNAVKYTNEGEISIHVESLNEREIGIIVSDTGIGIPSEHLPRIFERFYVVDKSRSRQTGGTGLGLAIVKHIVELHGGKIFVESRPSKGTKFIVILPSNR